MTIKNEWLRQYSLIDARRKRSTQKPQPHQEDALVKLKTWFESTEQPSGALLVLPTGGGKTFTAVRFLCQQALAQNYKVLWLAHTHHLLEQAFEEFAKQVGHIGTARRTDEVMVRVVSGEAQYSKVRDVKATDDLVIATLQTITRAFEEERLTGLQGFLTSSKTRFLVIFDEAHHAAAVSYRQFLMKLRDRDPSVKLLGLTATPLDGGTGWLKKLFPQKDIYQISPSALMAQGILAKPIKLYCETKISPEINEVDLERWRKSAFKDLPENIVDSLANNEERNLRIVNEYVQNKKKYGKTIIFVDRWYQCEVLKAMLEKRKIRAGVVFSVIQASAKTVAERNKNVSRKTENDQALKAFKTGELEVLINVKMLTEGTDVPDAQTVFLTRQTTSQILLTQMVGRALRGEKFGGTKEAFIVMFTDQWKIPIQFAEFNLQDGSAEDTEIKRSPRAAFDLIAVELISRFTDLMDSGSLGEALSFLSLIPLGWYSTTYTRVVEGTDDLEQIQKLVMVFDQEKAGFEKFIEYAQRKIPFFGSSVTTFSSVESELQKASARYFLGTHRYQEESFRGVLFDVARHIAHNAEAPVFFPFERRDEHNLEAVAEQFIAADLGPRAIMQSLETEYHRQDRFWRNLYWSFAKFKEHYDGCQNVIIMGNKMPQAESASYTNPETYQDREPSEERKSQVKQRDNNLCVCCGSSYRLQIDHIAPSYFGGQNSLENLQTLCATCNNFKGTKEIQFRNRNKTLLTVAPAQLEPVPLPKDYTNNNQWAEYLKRRINFFYQCSAVVSVSIGLRGDTRRNWQIEIYQGNPLPFIKPFLKLLLQEIRDARGEQEIPLESITFSDSEKKPIIVR